MIADGDLTAEPEPTDPVRYRWNYVTVYGAQHVGPRLYKTERAALIAGRNWLAEQGRP